MSEIIFSKRMELEKEYLAWISENNLENCASNMIAFLDGKKKLLHDLGTLPTYYLLRRTVGGAMGHYEYDDAYNGWVVEQYYASIYQSKEHAESRRRRVGPCDIIPVKLMEVQG